MGIFNDLFGGMQYPMVTEQQMKALRQWLQGVPSKYGPNSGAGMEQSALSQMFKSAQDAVSKGTPFYESMIPKAPGALSPAAAAEKAAATDALQSSLGGERVAQMGQLGREYGGRLPASMVQSGFGSLARAGAGGATDIARNAVLENINLGEQGVQGLAGLTGVSGAPLSQASGMIATAPSGGYMDKGALNKVADTVGNIATMGAKGVAGFAGLGGGGMGTGTFGSNPFGGGPGGSYGGAFGLPTGGLPLNTNNRQYLPMGGLG